MAIKIKKLDCLNSTLINAEKFKFCFFQKPQS